MSIDAAKPSALAIVEVGAAEVGAAETETPEGNRDRLDVPSWQSAAGWVESMDLTLQRAWIQTLMCVKSNSSRAPSDPSPVQWTGLSSEEITTASEQLEGLSDASDQEAVVKILLATDAMQDYAASGEFQRNLWAEIAWWANPLLDSLDQAALSRVTDGTFWTGADSDAFYLQLARSNELPDDGAVTTGTLPLLQQPDTYQGQRVRLVGTLQLAQRQDAKSNRVGVDGYWKLWIIPADGGIRPTILMAEQLPEVLINSLTDEGKWDRTRNPSNPAGQIAAVGRFIKRLPYRSSIGADLAPVVIGRIVATRGQPAAVVDSKAGNAASGPGKASPADSQSHLLGILLAVIGGIVIAGGLMYRTSQDAKRSRELRKLATEKSKVDLDGLSEDRRRIGGKKR